MRLTAGQTLARLKQAMASKGDFPAVSSSIEHILQSMADSSSRSEEQMTALVLSDFAMTQKVLRLANSTMYAAFGPVATVSMALYVLGTETVGHIAMGLKLIDNFGQAADTRVAKQELAKAVVAGAIARSVGFSASGKDGEPLAVATLIRCLGKLLVCFYLPDQFAVIGAAHPSFEDESRVSTDVLGLAYDELALTVADNWNLPPELKASACPSLARSLDNAQTALSHAITGYALQYTTAVAVGSNQDELAELTAKHAEAIGVPAVELLSQAQTAVNLALAEPDGISSYLLPPTSAETGQKSTTGQLSANELTTRLAELEAGQAKTPGQILGLATEALWQGLSCTKLMLFLRNRQTATFDLVQGRGPGVAESLRTLRFPEVFSSPSVVHVALAKNNPIYLDDALAPNIAKSIPSWLQDATRPARHIFLLPFSVHGQPAGIVYLDWDSPRSALSKEEEVLIERLRTVVNNALSQAMANAIKR